MRSLTIVIAMVALFAFAASTQAADPGQVPDDTLAKLGLGGMEKMTDAEGEQVRGKWYFSTLAGSTAANIYNYLGGVGAVIHAAGAWHPWSADHDPFQIVGAETQAQRNFRHAVERVNLLYSVVFPAGIPGTNFGPNSAFGGQRPFVW